MGPSLRRARCTGRSAKAPSPSNTAVTASTCRREWGRTLGDRSPTARVSTLGEERLRRQQIPRASFADGYARRTVHRRFRVLCRAF
jgi:hypothetical protein